MTMTLMLKDRSVETCETLKRRGPLGVRVPWRSFQGSEGCFLGSQGVKNGPAGVKNVFSEISPDTSSGKHEFCVILEVFLEVPGGSPEGPVRALWGL